MRELNTRFQSVFQYLFVVTILWLGFVTAISFMETPIRFQAEEVPRAHLLRIGHLVFHSLNKAELLFASLTLVGLVSCQWTKVCRWTGYLLLTILLLQTWLLFTILDERTLARIRGEELAPSHWHSVYIGMELVKLTLLIALAVMQIRQWQRNVCRPDL